MKDNDFSPPSESTTAPMAADAKNEVDEVADEDSIRSDGDGSSSKGDAIVGNIRYVSCSVAGSDPLEHPKENENEGTFLHIGLNLMYSPRFGLRVVFC